MLGYHVHEIRKAHAQKPSKALKLSRTDSDNLNAMGFVWNLFHHRRKLNVLAYETYKKLFKTDAIPRSFVVPTSSEWPQEVWSMKLGINYSNVRFLRTFRPMKEILERKTQFDFSRNQRKESEERIKLCLQALRSYQRLHGSVVSLPRTFIVPHADSAYPPATWGILLGPILDKLKYRKNKTSDNFRAQLRAEFGIKFELDSTDRRFRRIRDALISFRDMHGHLNVPLNYMVPTEEKGNDGGNGGSTVKAETKLEISQDSSGTATKDLLIAGDKPLFLGRVLYDIKRGLTYRMYVDDLKAIGVTF